jgi:hypothetical protein
MPRVTSRPAAAVVSLCVLALCPAGASAVDYLTPVGSINVGQPLARIVADPVRGKVYGFTAAGDVLFIDRASLSVQKTIPTGRALTDIDVASDGSFMTVLDNVTRGYWNQPPAVYAIKYDLATQTQSGFTMVQSPLYHMALGRPNRIVGVQTNQWVNVFQNDATTGAQLSTAGGGYFGSGSTDYETVTLVTNPQGTRLFRTDIGISSIAVMAWDISGDSLVPAGSRGVGSYATEPVFINSNGSSLYVGDLRLNPMNLNQVLGVFPETIYAANADNTLAFGATSIFDPAGGGKLGNMPLNSSKMVLGEYDRYLYAWNASTNRLNVYQVIPEPASLATATIAASLALLSRRRRDRHCR